MPRASGAGAGGHMDIYVYIFMWGPPQTTYVYCLRGVREFLLDSYAGNLRRVSFTGIYMSCPSRYGNVGIAIDASRS